MFIKNINSIAFPGKLDPQPFFDDTRANWWHFNRIPSEDLLGSMVMSSTDVCVIKKVPLCNMLMVLQRDLKDVDLMGWSNAR